MNSIGPWPYRLYRSIWSGLDLLYPPACGGCGRRGERFCRDCIAGVTVLRAPLCEKCGRPHSAHGPCGQCLADPPAFDMLRSWGGFEGPLRAALHKLKYKRDVSLGDALTAPFATFVRELSWEPDLLVPIPLGRRRLAERGYNQVGLVGRPLALALGLKYSPRVLMRKRETPTQVGLSASQRKQNMQDAFGTRNEALRGRTVLLLDDVATTGATLSAAARSLRAGGAARVLAVTVARALLHQA